MRATIIKPDNIIGIDGFFINIDLSTLPDNLRVVQWDGVNGHEEWIDKEITPITDISPYNQFFNTWAAAKAEIDAIAANPLYGLTIDEVKAVIRTRIKTEKKLREDGGLRMDTFWYPSDAEWRFTYLDWKDEARDQLAAGAVKTDTLLIDDLPATIDRLDGINQTLTIGNIFTLVDKCRRLNRKLEVAMKAHIDAIKTAPDPAVYDYKTTLWPNRYVDTL